MRDARYRAAARPRERSMVESVCGIATAHSTHSGRAREDRDRESGETRADRGRQSCPRPASTRATVRRLPPFAGGDDDERLQLQEALLADAPHVHQVLDLLEAAALLAVLEDPFGRGLADAGQRLELRDGCRVQIHRARRRGFRRWRRPARSCPARPVPQRRAPGSTEPPSQCAS